jgi:hypothetical protein
MNQFNFQIFCMNNKFSYTFMQSLHASQATLLTQLSPTNIIHISQQDLISICNALILDTYMHVVPYNNITCQPHIYVRVHLLLQKLCKSTPPFTFQHTTHMIWCMDIQQRPDNAQLQHNNYQRQCKSTPPITLTISTTIALSSIHVHTFNKSQFK